VRTLLLDIKFKIRAIRKNLKLIGTETNQIMGKDIGTLGITNKTIEDIKIMDIMHVEMLEEESIEEMTEETIEEVALIKELATEEETEVAIGEDSIYRETTMMMGIQIMETGKEGTEEVALIKEADTGAAIEVAIEEGVIWIEIHIEAAEVGGGHNIKAAEWMIAIMRKLSRMFKT
jgi:hypothetical protein